MLIAMSSDASLTNIKMVKPKGPRVFLAVIGLAAVGGAAWWLTRPTGPVGEAEDPRKILVLGKDADVANTLRELGFLAEHGSFDALAAEGAQQGAKGTGVAAILHLADLRGIGYVAIEDPASHGFEGLTVTADSHEVAAGHRWAVFSVGELGMPPKVTVDAETSELPLPPYIELMRAAFAQQRLANTLFADNQLPMDAVEIHRQIKPAVDLYGAYAVLDKRVAKEVRKRTEVLVDGEQAAAKPAVLAGSLETSEVLALGDGTVLSFVHGQRLESPRDVEVSIQPSTEVELWFQPPGSSDPKARQRCTSLRGGTMALGGTEVELAARADALLLEIETGLELWTLDTKAGACAWSRKGALPRPLEGEYTWGVPHATGKVLRPAMRPDGMTIEVWSTGADRPESVPLAGCTQIGDPVWLDEGHFAVACGFVPSVPEEDPYAYDDELGEEELAAEPAAPTPPPVPAQGWIYVVRLADARAVAIPGTVLGEHTGIYTLHVVPSSKGLELLAVHPWGGKLLRLRAEKGHAELFAGAEVTFAMLGDHDAKAAAEAAKAAEELLEAAAKGRPVPAPVPAPVPVTPAMPTDPAAEPTPVLRPAFVPSGGMVAALAPEGFTVSSIDVGGEFEGVALSLDGTRIVLAADRAHEVRVLTLEGGASTVIAKTPDARHMEPRFTADGKAVAFTSEFEGNERSEQVGRIVVLGK
jgi:hypothetical protein